MKQKKSFKRWLGQEHVAGYICSAPFIFGFLMFMIVPMAICLYYAFCDYNITNPPVWSGLKNLKTAFTGDELFWKSLRVTCIYALIGTPLKVIFALIVALILCRCDLFTTPRISRQNHIATDISFFQTHMILCLCGVNQLFLFFHTFFHTFLKRPCASFLYLFLKTESCNAGSC